jgi:hypothetical protein
MMAATRPTIFLRLNVWRLIRIIVIMTSISNGHASPSRLLQGFPGPPRNAPESDHRKGGLGEAAPKKLGPALGDVPRY